MVARPEPALAESSVVRRSPAVGTVAVGTAAVLVDEPGGRAHALNPTGAVVWECLDGDGDLGGLIDDLAEGFGAERSVVAADVVDLARELARLGLLEGFDADADAWPAEFDPGDGGDCEPDGSTAAPAFDDRYLAAPPNA